MRTRKGTGRLRRRANVQPRASRRGAPRRRGGRRVDEEGGAEPPRRRRRHSGLADGASGVAGRSEGASGSVDGEAPGGSGGSVGMDAARRGWRARSRRRGESRRLRGERERERRGGRRHDRDRRHPRRGRHDVAGSVPSSRELPRGRRLRRRRRRLRREDSTSTTATIGAGATPAPDRGALVDGFNDPMTGVWTSPGKEAPATRRGPPTTGGDAAQARARAHGEAKTRRRRRRVPARPRERERRSHPSIHEATYPPPEYWRGETKRYVRVHQSLPTVEIMTHRTPNPMWPRHKTPHHAHGGGAITAVGGTVPFDSEQASRRAGERRGDARSRRRHAHLWRMRMTPDAETVAAGRRRWRRRRGRPRRPRRWRLTKRGKGGVRLRSPGGRRLGGRLGGSVRCDCK